MSKEFTFLYSLCVCTRARVCCILGSKKSTSDLLEQELQVVVSHPAWCWKPNSGCLQGHMILSTEASLWTYFQSIFHFHISPSVHFWNVLLATSSPPRCILFQPDHGLSSYCLLASPPSDVTVCLLHRGRTHTHKAHIF